MSRLLSKFWSNLKQQKFRNAFFALCVGFLGHVIIDWFRFPSFESCLAKDDFNCLVRSAYRELVYPPIYSSVDERAFQTSPESEKAAIGSTLAFIGEIDLALKIFESQKRFSNKVSIGGAIIGRLAHDNEEKKLRSFLGSIKSATLLTSVFRNAEGELSRISDDRKKMAISIFVDLVKKLVAEKGPSHFTTIEPKNNSGFVIDRMPLAVMWMPSFAMWPEHWEWYIPLVREVDDPKLQQRFNVSKAYGLDIYSPNFEEKFPAYIKKLKKLQLEKTEKVGAAKNALGFKKPFEYAESSNDKWVFSDTEQKFKDNTRSNSVMIRPEDLTEDIVFANSLISPKISNQLEEKFNSISIKPCRISGLLGLAKAHVRRDNIKRATDILTNVMKLEPEYLDQKKDGCNSAGRLYALTFKSLLGDKQAMERLVSEFQNIYREGGFSAHLDAWSPPEYKKPFVGTEEIISHQNRIRTVNSLLEIANHAYPSSIGKVEFQALVYLMDSNDRKLWMHLARETLRQSEGLSSSLYERRRLKMLRIIAVEGRGGAYL